MSSAATIEKQRKYSIRNNIKNDFFITQFCGESIAKKIFPNVCKTIDKKLNTIGLRRKMQNNFTGNTLINVQLRLVVPERGVPVNFT